MGAAGSAFGSAIGLGIEGYDGGTPTQGGYSNPGAIQGPKRRDGAL